MFCFWYLSWASGDSHLLLQSASWKKRIKRFGIRFLQVIEERNCAWRVNWDMLLLIKARVVIVQKNGIIKHVRQKITSFHTEATWPKLNRFYLAHTLGGMMGGLAPVWPGLGGKWGRKTFRCREEFLQVSIRAMSSPMLFFFFFANLVFVADKWNEMDRRKNRHSMYHPYLHGTMWIRCDEGKK